MGLSLPKTILDGGAIITILRWIYGIQRGEMIFPPTLLGAGT